MAYHMHNLLKSKKAQFFILSTVAIISVIYLISRLFEPSNIIDTSSVILNEAPFIFDNIKEKANATVAESKSCEDALFNLEEYKKFVKEYAFRKGIGLGFDYSATCSGQSFTANIRQNLTALGIFIESNYTLIKTW
jgi:hypothetical protein